MALSEALNRKGAAPVAVSFAEVARRYVEFRRSDGSTAPGTVLRISHAMDRVLDALGARAVSEASITDVQDQLRRELAPVTTNLYMGFAGRAWRWAAKRDLVDSAWPDVERVRHIETLLRPCTHAETTEILEAMLTYGDGRYYPYFALVTDMGSRSTETCSIVERDVDRDRNTIRLRITKTRSRTVHVDPEVIELLPRREGLDDNIFMRVHGGPFNRHTVKSAWNAVMRKLGWERLPITCHSLRGTWITDSLRLGVPITQSMRHTGHRTTKIHIDYQRNAPDQRMAQVAATVRRSRPRLPHLYTVATRRCGEGGLESVTIQETQKEAMGLTRSRCSARETHTPLQDRDLCGLAPPQDTSARTLVARLGLEGEDVREALGALVRDPALRALLLELTKQDD